MCRAVTIRSHWWLHQASQATAAVLYSMAASLSQNERVVATIHVIFVLIWQRLASSRAQGKLLTGRVLLHVASGRCGNDPGLGPRSSVANSSIPLTQPRPPVFLLLFRWLTCFSTAPT